MRRRLRFGEASRGAGSRIAGTRETVLAIALPFTAVLMAIYAITTVAQGGEVPVIIIWMASICGACCLLRRYHQAYAIWAFLGGSFLSLVVYTAGFTGAANGLASGSAHTLCLYPLLVWTVSCRRGERLATTGLVALVLAGLYAVGQPATQAFAVPTEVMQLSLLRCYVMVGFSLAIAYGFDLSINASTQRYEDALAKQSELYEDLEGKAAELEKSTAALSATHERLRTSESHYRELFDNAFDGIVVFDGVRDCAVEVNPTLAKRLGYTAKELMEAHPVDISPEYQANGRASTDARKETAASILVQPSYSYPWRHLTRTGEPVDFEIHTFWLNGNNEFRISVLRDVTEQKRAEAALQLANRELLHFTHAASHDLKEPLRTMANFAKLLERRYASHLDLTGREYIGFITDAGERGTRLVSDLLRYAEAGTDEVELESVDLGATGRQVLATLDARLRDEGAELTIGLLPHVRLTETWAQQLLQNIISNALKFRRPGVVSRVEVRSAETPTAYEVAISDNGIGIAEESLPRVFAVFTRLVARDQYEGSGIGLALCRRIMERAGGGIRVESVLGEGTTFTLSFPKEAAFAKTPDARPDQASSRSRVQRAAVG